MPLITSTPYKVQLVPSSFTEDNFFETSDGDSSSIFGRSVAISNDKTTIVGGAVGEDAGATNAGAAYVFTDVPPWTEQQKLQGSQVASSTESQMGESIALSSDGNILLVGAHGEDSPSTNNGAAYVFTRTGSTWSEAQRLTGNSVSLFFGWSVDMTPDGNTLVIGAYAGSSSPYANGCVYVFTKNSGSPLTWSLAQILFPDNPGSNDRVGYGVAISDDGDRIIAGAPREDTGGSNTGIAYIFTRTAGSPEWVFEAAIKGDDLGSSTSPEFGQKVDINSDGTTVIVGAPQEDSEGTNAGAAYVFIRGSGSPLWTQQAKLVGDDISLSSSASFSDSLAISSSGNMAVIGAWTESDAGATSNAGAAYVFYRDGTVWNQLQKLQSSNKTATYYFGYSVDISSDASTIVVGETRQNTDEGYVYVFTN